MIFWRILDNKLYTVGEVDRLGFEESEGLRVPDEYIEQKEFTVMRTAHGVGDWGIISAMPRLLKQKYPMNFATFHNGGYTCERKIMNT